MAAYRDRERRAALILLQETPLGDAVEWTDCGDMLSVRMAPTDAGLSAGEAAVGRLLRDIHNWFDTLNEINRFADDACKSAVLRSLAALFGTDRCPVHLADGPLCCTQARGHEGGHVYEGSSCPQRGDTEAVQS